MTGPAEFEFPPDLLPMAGVDEAGRGPLAGPVMAAAVILDPTRPIEGLRDSKKLTPQSREALAEQIRDRALAWSVARAEVEEIERINILHASLLAMQRAVAGLLLAPQLVLVDGNRCPPFKCRAQALIKGDDRVPAISAASILAKVVRDREMVAMEQIYPGYGFAQHKGYTCRQHLDALLNLGVTPIHRRQFGPVRQRLEACGNDGK